MLSAAALGVINRAGFRVNHNKTRMQCRPSCQSVTGLTVNHKVNIRAQYYRKARKMCSSLFNHGVVLYRGGGRRAAKPGCATRTADAGFNSKDGQSEGVF